MFAGLWVKFMCAIGWRPAPKTTLQLSDRDLLLKALANGDAQISAITTKRIIFIDSSGGRSFGFWNDADGFPILTRELRDAIRDALRTAGRLE